MKGKEETRLLDLFQRLVNDLPELSEGGVHRESWWDSARTIRAADRNLYRVLKSAANRYDTLTTARERAGHAVEAYIKQNDQIGRGLRR